MKFGVREIANVVFRAKNAQKIGSMTFQKGQPVFYLDTAKTSSMEGGATTVYATGGRGNTRLVTWEGERTLTFTVEDALLSPISFGMLSGAGIIKGSASDTKKVHFHQYSKATVNSTGTYIDLTDALAADEKICPTAPIYVLGLDNDGEITGQVYKNFTVTVGTVTGAPAEGKGLKFETYSSDGESYSSTDVQSKNVMVDYYVLKAKNKVTQLSIDAKHFGGYFYVEADTLFRTKDGKDLPANLTFPNVKIQSNFTFSMASSGDPSTFTFTMDAMPGYTYFNNTDEVLCAIQIVDDEVTITNESKPLFDHPSIQIEESQHDSSPNASDDTANS